MRSRFSFDVDCNSQSHCPPFCVSEFASEEAYGEAVLESRRATMEQNLRFYAGMVDLSGSGEAASAGLGFLSVCRRLASR